MKKEIRKFRVPFSFDWTYGIELSQIKSDIQELEKLGVTYIEIEPEMCYDSASVLINAFCERIETDEEYAQRIDEIYKKKKEIEKRELEQLEKLKSKYKQ